MNILSRLCYMFVHATPKYINWAQLIQTQLVVWHFTGLMVRHCIRIGDGL